MGDLAIGWGWDDGFCWLVVGMVWGFLGVYKRKSCLLTNDSQRDCKMILCEFLVLAQNSPVTLLYYDPPLLRFY